MYFFFELLIHELAFLCACVRAWVVGACEDGLWCGAGGFLCACAGECGGGGWVWVGARRCVTVWGKGGTGFHNPIKKFYLMSALFSTA